MKVGDCITVKYVSAYKKTQISFMKVTKIGHKYVYGVTLWNPEKEGIREGHPIKYDLNNIMVYPGIRQDLRDILDKYELNSRQWQRDRDVRDNEVDWELRDLKEKIMDEWNNAYPIPQIPELPPN